MENPRAASVYLPHLYHRSLYIEIQRRLVKSNEILHYDIRYCKCYTKS